MGSRERVRENERNNGDNILIWTDELCRRLIDAFITEKQTYSQLADTLAIELGEPINPEQLRSALRRYTARSNQALQRQEQFAIAPVVEKKPIPILTPTVHTAREVKPTRVRFGALGDTHLCSNYEDLDALHKLYAIYKQEGVSVVYHTGNWIDGEARFNANDLNTRGMDAQLKYFIANYPKIEGIETRFIDGDDHEGWYTQNFGIQIGAHLEDMARRAGRTDLVYLGYMEADTPIVLPDGTQLLVRTLHAGGGSSYALSHTSQKLVDGWDDDERPFILLVGHYHKAEYLPNYRGVRIIQTGTFQHQTPFMRKKRLHADIGGWIVDVSVIDDKTTRVAAEFIHFGSKPWKHVMR